MPTESQPDSRPTRKVAILFAGGPAPAANAVISTAAAAFNDDKDGDAPKFEVYGILHGYSHLADFKPGDRLEKDRDYIVLDQKALRRTRNSRGILIGTARTNPGKDVKAPGDLADPKKTAPLGRVYEALASLNVEALISIGGDDTLKTANKFKLFQEHLPADRPRIAVVHVPKTIDNDYYGIDFTFGYISAVETLAAEIRNLLADAEAVRSYYLVETMGRSAGWLAYGAAIAGEASYVLSVEDIRKQYLTDEAVFDYDKNQPVIDPQTGRPKRRPIMDMKRIDGTLSEVMVKREAQGKPFGVIVLAEGLAEMLPQRYLKRIPRDDHGHIAISLVGMNRIFAKRLSRVFRWRTGTFRKVNGLQLGYEARCTQPSAFDVILGSQLGVGAYRALVQRRLDGVMVSVSGQFKLDYVEFEELVDRETLVTKVRRITPDSDFHTLARFLETKVDE